MARDAQFYRWTVQSMTFARDEYSITILVLPSCFSIILSTLLSQQASSEALSAVVDKLPSNSKRSNAMPADAQGVQTQQRSSVFKPRTVVKCASKTP